MSDIQLFLFHCLPESYVHLHYAAALLILCVPVYGCGSMSAGRDWDSAKASKISATVQYRISRNLYPVLTVKGELKIIPKFAWYSINQHSLDIQEGFQIPPKYCTSGTWKKNYNNSSGEELEAETRKLDTLLGREVDLKHSSFIEICF